MSERQLEIQRGMKLRGDKFILLMNISNVGNALKNKLLRETDFTLSVIRDLHAGTKNEKSRD
jgi:hypothetical protein